MDQLVLRDVLDCPIFEPLDWAGTTRKRTVVLLETDEDVRGRGLTRRFQPGYIDPCSASLSG
jgi:hypothetical protein